MASSGLLAKVLAPFGLDIKAKILPKASARPSGLCFEAKTLASVQPQGPTFGFDLGLVVKVRDRSQNVEVKADEKLRRQSRGRMQYVGLEAEAEAKRLHILLLKMVKTVYNQGRNHGRKVEGDQG